MGLSISIGASVDAAVFLGVSWRVGMGWGCSLQALHVNYGTLQPSFACGTLQNSVSLSCSLVAFEPSFVHIQEPLHVEELLESIRLGLPICDFFTLPAHPLNLTWFPSFFLTAGRAVALVSCESGLRASPQYFVVRPTSIVRVLLCTSVDHVGDSGCGLCVS